MNWKTYIESGQLEAYVAGLLSEAEMQEVDRMIQQHPEVAAEVEAIRQAVAEYTPVTSDGPQLPSLESIMERANAESQSKEAPLSFPTEAKVLPLTPPTEERTFHPWRRFVSMIAAAMILVGFGLTWNLSRQVSVLEDQVLELQANNDYMQQQYQAFRQSPAIIQPAQPVLEDPAQLIVSLKGMPQAPDALVKVYWHNQSKDIYLHIHNLPEPPSDHQYQLWAIIDGVSVDAGIFDHNDQLQRLRNMPGKVEAFAVTLEPKGGKPIPSLERMYAKGIVKA